MADARPTLAREPGIGLELTLALNTSFLYDHDEGYAWSLRVVSWNEIYTLILRAIIKIFL
jgi:hypothetical protein